MSIRGFWQDIAEHPDDDAPRLILADWLEDHGDEAQAEFIRVQIRRARLPIHDPEQPGLARREAELLARYEARWAGDLSLVAKDWSFHRGVIEQVQVGHLAPLLDYLHEQPLPLRSVHWERLGELRHPDDLARLRYLRELIAGYVALTAQELAALVDSPHLQSLQHLHLQAAHLLGPLTVEMLFQAPWFKQLKYLNLSMNNLTADSLRLLTESSKLPNLRELVLSYNNLIGNAGVIQLLRSPLARSLKLLDLSETGLTSRGIRDMASLPHLDQLETLRLANNDLGGAGVEALLRSPHLEGLRHLDLSGTRFGLRGLRALCEGSFLPNLTELKIKNVLLGPDGLRDLLACPLLGQLQRLELSNNPLLARGARLLAELSPKVLRLLDLSACQLGDAGLEQLCTSTRLVNLHTLYLHGNGIGLGGIHALANTPYLPQLRVLGLRLNALDSQAVQALAASPYLQLTELQIGANSLRAEEREQLHDRFGGCVHD
ncbi:MAG: TIGR02996 domain-containing protein [Gemmataceae bacterium]